jgi:hypothetical protein
VIIAKDGVMMVATVSTYDIANLATATPCRALHVVVMVVVMLIAEQQRQRREQRGNNIYCHHNKRV